MIRNKILSRFIVVTLTAALLLFMGGRAIPVYALADHIPQIVAPVYDTTIYQLQDYIDSGGLTDPQMDLFYILCGVLVLAQAGSEQYQLVDPYTTRDGALGWLKSCGIQLYNSVVSLTPDTIRLPDGSIMSTTKTKELMKFAVAQMMGNAVFAANYSTVQEFINDVEHSEEFFLPFDRDLQVSMNTIFEMNNGIFHWQQAEVNSSDLFEFIWNTNAYSNLTLGYLANNALPLRIVRANSDDTYWGFKNIAEYLPTVDIFLNYTDGIAYFYHNDSLINYFTGTNYAFYCDRYGSFYSNTQPMPNYNATYFTDIQYGAAPFSNVLTPLNAFNAVKDLLFIKSNDWKFNIGDCIGNVYWGTSYANKQLLSFTTDLNFADSTIPYYLTMQDNYLLDFKGILDLILNNVDLIDLFINNIWTPNGVKVNDPELIQVTKEIRDYYEDQNPPLPVNLNEIADYTDNSYLDRIKEEARRGGNELAALVAFWHNCDPEIIYVLFGAGITVLVGAFIGKWGHS